MTMPFRFVRPRSSSSFSDDRHSNSGARWSSDRRAVSFGNGKFLGVDSLQRGSEVSNALAISLSILDSIGRRSAFNDESSFSIRFLRRFSSNVLLQILPPSIEFVLPSPALGVANLQTVDPPWMPHAKTLVQQVALNQEEVVRRSSSRFSRRISFLSNEFSACRRHRE